MHSSIRGRRSTAAAAVGAGACFEFFLDQSGGFSVGCVDA